MHSNRCAMHENARNQGQRHLERIMTVHHVEHLHQYGAVRPAGATATLVGCPFAVQAPGEKPFVRKGRKERKGSEDCWQSKFTDICCLTLSFASFADKCSCSEPRYMFVDTRKRRGA
jgi:hypothetical protein